ncbi:Maf family nucleotide pyrophosphatase [Desertihabitans brevis]|uniref:Maf family nucleotide pyrophosphatase n=1 Tax=Desertihabitans brevis TaxID=2268447 RepID=UPI001313E468|nr:Maf family nucleotide pyrophosphatase [Desertihabitans brevis]
MSTPGADVPRPVRRFVLASQSPARLATLRAAGVHPEVVVSGVDESGVQADTPAVLAARLALLKAETVARRLGGDLGPDEVVVGCDSVLELDGEAFGKPRTPEVARERWRAMRGRSGVLHTGHHVHTGAAARTATASTVVHFADVGDDELEDYLATGEPLQVAGAFTLDGFGGAFVRGVEGDPHSVVGISLPLLRELLADLGLSWTSLWRLTPPAPPATPAPTLTLGSVVLQVADLERAAAFWTQALGLHPDPRNPAFLVPPGGGTRLHLDTDDRTHLDLWTVATTDVDAEVERLLALGASRAEWEHPPGADFVVLTDPDGHHFCVVGQ